MFQMQRKLDCCSKRLRLSCKVAALVRGGVHKRQGSSAHHTRTLDFCADRKNQPSFCGILCAIKRVFQTANCRAVRRRIACPSVRSKSAMSLSVFFISLRDRLLCTDLVDLLSRQVWHSRSVAAGGKAPLRTTELASNLPACTRSLLLQLCSVKRGREACRRAATLVSRETTELPERSLVTPYRAHSVPKSES